MVQETVAYQVDQAVGGHAGPVVGKVLRVFLDEGYDIVQFLLRRSETAVAVCRDDVFFAAHPSAVPVHTDVAGIAQPVAPVQAVTGILQYVLDVYPPQEIVVCQVSFSHCSCSYSVVILIFIYLPLPKCMSLFSAFMAASKFLAATSIGESTPGLK